MRNKICFLLILITLAFSCKDDDIALFDKSAEERTTEAIANLKSELVAPENGWVVKYQPVESSGSYYLLLKFFDNDQVVISSDLGSNNGEFFEDTLTYRIDSSLGLELIFETYSFFSFLFEQNSAAFLAEYEFLYQNKTESNELVFRSKTDQTNPTIIVFQPAVPSSVELLGRTTASRINLMEDDTYKYRSTLRLVYDNKDLAFVFNLQQTTRMISFSAAYAPSDGQQPMILDIETAYYLRGDSIVLHTPITGTFLGHSVELKGFAVGDTYQKSLAICDTPIEIDGVTAITTDQQSVSIETSFDDPRGAAFTDSTTFLWAYPEYVSERGVNRGADIVNDIPGTARIDLYYKLPLNGGDSLTALGVFIDNPGGQPSFALREFTLEKVGNNLIFTFAPEISMFGAPTDAPVENMNYYLEALTEGGKTYAFHVFDRVYEFYNPCNGWSFIFVDGD